MLQIIPIEQKLDKRYTITTLHHFKTNPSVGKIKVGREEFGGIFSLFS